MSEYISREAALEVVKRYFTELLELNPDICLDGIKSIPAADVAEVVRCKDCIYWEEYDGTNGELNCGYCSEIMDRTTYYLFFCADGNRKDGDED